MHLTEVLDSPTKVNEEVLQAHTRLLDKALELDIEVTGMSHEWFLPKGCRQSRGHAMPRRNLSSGSLYMQALEMLEQSWYTMVSCFPQVAIWEVGNEWNLNLFLQPDGFMESGGKNPFTADEKMDIAVDMMYYSARGIRRANPNAKVASFSATMSITALGGDMPDYLPAMYGIAWTLDKVYSRIKSGVFPSTDTDDYFDMLAWHPYHISTETPKSDYDAWLKIEKPDHLWKDYNDAAYRVMCKYGDAHKQVLLTEMGFTDCGDPEAEERNAAYTEEILRMVSELPYVRTIHNFRLLNENGMLTKSGPENNQIGGLPEIYFGLFTDPEDGCRPRKRAFAIQRFSGKKGDLISATPLS